MFWATVALSVNPNVSEFTEAAALIPIFVESTQGRDNYTARLGSRGVDLIFSTLPAGSIDEVVSECADA
jgi:hypothetical protein